MSANSILAPGPAGTNDVGTLTVNNNLDLQAGSMLHINIQTGACDRVTLTGGSRQLSLGGSSLAVVLPPGYKPSASTPFTIVNGFATRTGTFAGLPEGAELRGGDVSFTISYLANSIVLNSRNIDSGSTFVVK